MFYLEQFSRGMPPSLLLRLSRHCPLFRRLPFCSRHRAGYKIKSQISHKFFFKNARRSIAYVLFQWVCFVLVLQAALFYAPRYRTIIYSYFSGKLWKFYFTEGSRDQFGRWNIKWSKIFISRRNIFHRLLKNT